MHVNPVVVYLLPAVIFTLLYLLGAILVAVLGRGPGRAVGAIGCAAGLLANAGMLVVVALLMLEVINFARSLGDVLLVIKLLFDTLAIGLLIVGVILTRAVKPKAPTLGR